MIIAEKPDAARRIAAALSQATLDNPKRGELPLYEINRNGDRIKVMSALGHLYTLKQSGKGWDYPVFEMEWVPKYEVEKSSIDTKPFIEKFRELSADAESFIVATDYDIEGETIAYCILKYACGEDALNKARRMKFSTLTDKELIEAYEHTAPQINFRMAEAGEVRHRVDWLFGINISRAMILAIKHGTGKYRTMSTGRVQGPTLTYIANREAAIRSFVPTPYWTINAEAQINGKIFPLAYSKNRISTKSEALQIINQCHNKKGNIKEIAKSYLKIPPPYPFDLGSLQAEAYKLFGFAPSRALSIAERLYLAALISYPRTGSQKIPQSVDARGIFQSLTQLPQYKSLATELATKEKLVPNQGSKDDPAHPPITPTGILPPRNGLLEPERKLYDLVVRRFMAVYGNPATSENITASVDIDGQTFYLKGRRIFEIGWVKFYGPYFRTEEILLPELQKGQPIEKIRTHIDEKSTSPPPRYNPSSLLKLMEEQEIGTKATRAEIMDTLARRGYVTGERIAITELGFAVVDVLRKYAPQVLSVDMTRQLEKDMERIQFGELRGKKYFRKPYRFLNRFFEISKRWRKQSELIWIRLCRKSSESQLRLGLAQCVKQGSLLL